MHPPSLCSSSSFVLPCSLPPYVTFSSFVLPTFLLVSPSPSSVFPSIPFCIPVMLYYRTRIILRVDERSDQLVFSSNNQSKKYQEFTQRHRLMMLPCAVYNGAI